MSKIQEIEEHLKQNLEPFVKGTFDSLFFILREQSSKIESMEKKLKSLSDEIALLSSEIFKIQNPDYD